MAFRPLAAEKRGRRAVSRRLAERARRRKATRDEKGEDENPGEDEKGADEKGERMPFSSAERWNPIKEVVFPVPGPPVMTLTPVAGAAGRCKLLQLQPNDAKNEWSDWEAALRSVCSSAVFSD